MGEHERGRLYHIKADGCEMEPFIIKKQALYIGSGDVCGIRLYSDGIFPEHCVLTTDKKGKIYFEPLHQTALVLVNHVKITKKYLLKHNDVITILMRSFRFAYPADSAYSEITVKTPTLPCLEETNLPKVRNSISPKNKVLPNFNDNTPVLRVKRSATEMVNEKNIQKKQRKSSLSGKKVRFGPQLAPEEFDKHLPPSSPLRRGSLPGKICSQNKEIHVLKQSLRLSSQLSLNTIKGNEALPEGSSSSSFIKRLRGSPLVNKSLIIANENSTTFTVNVEVHSGPKAKIDSPIKKPYRRTTSSSSTTTEDFQPTSQILMQVDDISETFELPISKITPKCGKNVSSNLLTLQKDQKPLFSEVLKKLTAPSDAVSKVNKERSPELNICRKKITSKYLEVQQKSCERLIHRQVLAVGSTGHANSPDTIILFKQRNTFEVDNTFKINVRRSPRTPRRAQYTFKRETTKNPAILLLQQNPSTVEQVEKENIVKTIVTPLKKCKKSDEFLTESGEASKESQELKSDAGVFENCLEDFVKSDFKVTPIQLKKATKSRKESIRKLDTICDDLYDIKISEAFKEAEELLPESKKGLKSKSNCKQGFHPKDHSNIEISEIKRNSGVLLPKQNDNVTVEQVEKGNIEKTEYLLNKEKSPKLLEKQDVRLAPTQPEKCKKFKDYIKQDSLPDNLCNVEINEYSEKTTDSNFQHISSNEKENEEDVKQSKKKAVKKSRKGGRGMQNMKENNVKELKKGSISEDKNLTSKSQLVNSSSNEKENKEDMKPNINEVVKHSRKVRKIVKVLNENEVVSLKQESSALGDNYLNDVKLKHGPPQNVSAKRTNEVIAEVDVKEIEKPLPKRRKVKKDCTTEKELKTTSHELSPCRRVTRSMAKKFSLNK